ncbi:MAG: ribonuclease H-like domain-containing protein [Acidobacteria bacterium]|nr:ribonuclease H-like domain-containing protein [Acidobacteriota bacterium]
MNQDRKKIIEEEWQHIQESETGSLKEKLERLIQSSMARDSARTARAEARNARQDDEEPRPHEEPLDLSQFDHGSPGECPLAIDSYHGRTRIGAGLELTGEILALISRDDRFCGIDPSRILYLDLETTGLSAGASNYAFLTGLGFFADDEFRIRQYFMRDFADEPEILANVEDFLERFDAVVTFNGRAFDLPLLESRFVLGRRRTRLSGLPHLDMLYPARQIWGERLESCSLRSLEENLLGVERHGDVPGADIPQVYFEYLKTQNPYWISKVFHHNRLDILSMMCVLTICHDLVARRSEAAIRDARDMLGLAFFYERRECYEQSSLYFSEALGAGVGGESKIRAIKRASLMHRRAGKRQEAMLLWRDGAEEDGLAALEFMKNMAIHLERQERRFTDAQAVVRDALERITRLSERHPHEPKLDRHRVDFEKRLERLVRRLARQRDDPEN